MKLYKSLVSFGRTLIGLGDPTDRRQRLKDESAKLGLGDLISVLDGSEVALEVLQAIGYRNVLKSATIISYNMQDYDFWGQGSLSSLLLRQLAFGASIRLVTTPPPGKATRQAFKLKYQLLSSLEKNGVHVFFNQKLHAKAYFFLSTSNTSTTIIGSANLTGPGFGLRLTPDDSLIEMAISCGDSFLFQKAMDFVENRILGDIRTEDYATWFSRNSYDIGKAGV